MLQLIEQIYNNVNWHLTVYVWDVQKAPIRMTWSGVQNLLPYVVALVLVRYLNHVNSPFDTSAALLDLLEARPDCQAVVPNNSTC